MQWLHSCIPQLKRVDILTFLVIENVVGVWKLFAWEQELYVCKLQDMEGSTAHVACNGSLQDCVLQVDSSGSELERDYKPVNRQPKGFLRVTRNLPKISVGKTLSILPTLP